MKGGRRRRVSEMNADVGAGKSKDKAVPLQI